MKEAPKCCQLCQDAEAPCLEVRHYRLMICASCKAKNQFGWRPEHEPVLLQGLQRGGLLIPDRTLDGLLPYDYQPPSDYAL